MDVVAASADPVHVIVETTDAFDWSPIIAALIAAVIAGIAVLFSGVAARAADRRARAEASWSRVTWALERATSDDPPTAKVGLTSLIALLDHKTTMTPADIELAKACADAIWDDVEGR